MPNPAILKLKLRNAELRAQLADARKELAEIRATLDRRTQTCGNLLRLVSTGTDGAAFLRGMDNHDYREIRESSKAVPFKEHLATRPQKT